MPFDSLERFGREDHLKISVCDFIIGSGAGWNDGGRNIGSTTKNGSLKGERCLR